MSPLIALAAQALQEFKAARDKVAQSQGLALLSGPIERSQGIQSRIPDQENYEDYARAYTLHPRVMRCLQIICQNAASVTMKVYQWKIGMGGAKEYTPYNDPFLDALLDVPCPICTRTEFLEALYAYLFFLNGNFYGEIVPYKNEDRAEYIFPLRSDLVTVVPGDNGIEGYLYKVNERDIKFMPDQILHIKMFNPFNPYVGIGNITAARLVLKSDFYARAYNDNILIRDETPDNVITTDQQLTKEQKDEVKERWRKAHGGVNKKDRTAILSNGFKWQDTFIRQRDMQYIQQIAANAKELSIVFGVPGTMLDGDEINYATARESTAWLWKHTIIPLVARVAEAFTQFFLPRYGKNLVAAHDLSTVDALRADMKLMAETIYQFTQTGVPLNDALTLLDISPEGFPYPWGYEPMTFGMGFGGGGSGGSGLDALLGATETGKARLPARYNIDLKDAKLAAHWYAYLRRMDEHGRMIEAAIEPEVDKIIKEVIGNLRESVHGAEILREIHPAAVTFDEDKAQREITKAIDLPLSRVYAAEHDYTMRALTGKSLGYCKASYGWDRLGEESTRYVGVMGSHVRLFTGSIKDSISAALRGITPEMLADGLPLSELTTKIREVIGMSEHYRAARIARTETGTVMNAAHYDVYTENSDVVKGPIWVATMSVDTRDTHRALNGQQVKLGEYFVSPSGVKLRYPHDPKAIGDSKAVASEVINCQCTTMGATE